MECVSWYVSYVGRNCYLWRQWTFILTRLWLLLLCGQPLILTMNPVHHQPTNKTKTCLEAKAVKDQASLVMIVVRSNRDLLSVCYKTHLLRVCMHHHIRPPYDLENSNSVPKLQMKKLRLSDITGQSLLQLKGSKQDMAAHAYSPWTSGDIDRRMVTSSKLACSTRWVPGQPGYGMRTCLKENKTMGGGWRDAKPRFCSLGPTGSSQPSVTPVQSLLLQNSTGSWAHMLHMHTLGHTHIHLK